MLYRPKRPALRVLLWTSLFAVLATAWPPAKAHLQALAVMRDVADQPVPWVAREVTGPVTRQDLTLEIAGQHVRARMYRPANQASAPAMVVFHGVHYLGIDEPRLMAFAAAIASCGIEVLTPELPDIKDYRVSNASVDTIGASVTWLAAQTGKPVGVMGLSFAGGLALVAAADPRYHPAFKFIMAVGSQDSMARVAKYYRTGGDVGPDGTAELLPAHEYGPLVLEYDYLEDLIPAEDIPEVRPVMRAHLYEDRAAEKQASVGLTQKEKTELLDLMNANSSTTQARIAAIAQKHAIEMAELSPDGRLATLNTPVYLLHGQADNIIPAAESLWIAHELSPNELKAILVSPVLSHLDLDGHGPGAMDEWRLLHFFAGVMRAAGSQ
jgi:pimeloyl-ACP methyl ester carboxylesterase